MAVGDVDSMKLDVFEEEKVKNDEPIENDVDINQLGLSVRSLNALKRIGKTKAFWSGLLWPERN